MNKRSTKKTPDVATGLLKAITQLPFDKTMLPLYFEILNSVSSPVVWRGMTEFLTPHLAENEDYKALLLGLLENSKTKGSRACFLASLESMDLSDDRSLQTLADNLKEEDEGTRDLSCKLLLKTIPRLSEGKKKTIREKIWEEYDCVMERGAALEEVIKEMDAQREK
ncbi:MAG: hypothetical protein IJR89_04510 [Clostridia bacterium]|nr:hypothetical protein [Clostridia bacterium]